MKYKSNNTQTETYLLPKLPNAGNAF